LRKVKASYSGNCIDVRRSSDDTTSSIGFSGNELDTTALEAFVNEEHTIADEDFSTNPADNGWTYNTGATWSADVLPFVNSSSSSTAYKNFGVADAVGTKIRVSFTISNYSGSGTIRFIKHGASFTETGNAGGTARSANGTYTQELTYSAIDTNQNWGFWTAGSFTGDIDNFEVVQIAADGFVTKWYDQSGTNHAEQATDNDQPQIVDAGSTILENGKPAIQFDGVDDTLLSSTSFAQPYTAFAVRKFDSASDQMLISHDTSTFYGVEFRFVATTRLSNGTYLNHSVSPTTTQGLLYALGNGSNSEISIDGGTTTTGNSGSAGASELSIGGRSSYYFNGALQEIIYFDSDQSDNRQDIEWNINNHYNIYTDSWDKQSAMEVRRAIDNETTNIGFVGKDLDTTALETFATESSPVLDDYTGAAAAYSLRKVRSAYTGSAVRVRRSSDDGLQDIGFDANGDLDTTALTTFVNEEYDHIDEDFSSDLGWTFFNGTSNISGGTLNFNTSTNDYAFYSYGAVPNQVVDIEFTISNYVSGGIFMINFGGGYSSPTYSANQTVTLTDINIGNGNQNWGFRAFGSFVGSIDNFKVTVKTADGAVTTWYDQSVPTETYDSDFSAGVDGFSATNPSNNTVTRLASVTDDYSTTVENVLQFEAATAGTNITQQLRNNLPLTVGGTYKVSFKMLIDSSNSPDGLVRAGLYDGAGTAPEDIPFGGKLTETGRWTTFTDVPITQGNVRLFFAGLDSSDSLSFNSTEGDKFYIADVSVDEVNDATQTTADNQPLIVSGGALVEENGKAAVEYDGADDQLALSSAISLGDSDFSVNLVYRSLRTSLEDYVLFGESGQSRMRLYDYQVQLYISNVTYDFASSNNFGSQYLYTLEADAARGLQVYRDGTATGSELTIASGDDFIQEFIGNGVTRPINGRLQEIIIFDSDQSTNRTGIEGNIGRYYNIDGFRDVFVSKWFDQSGNFNHAENSTDTEQPQIVDGGTLVTMGGASKAAIEGLTSSLALSTALTPTNFSIIHTSEGAGFVANIGQYIRISDYYRYSIDGNNYVSSDTNAAQQSIYVGNRNGTTLNLRRNGSEMSSSPHTSVTTALNITSIFNYSSFNYTGKMSEFIIFESDQSSNLTDIESNINKHFKIYE
jgi:hypothetical protein